MSILHMSLVMDHLDAAPAVKLVALILADHADSDGICWPSYRRIAERSCLSERTVRRYVGELVRAGVVRKLKTGGLTSEGGARVWTTNHYRIEAEALAALPSLLKVVAEGHPEGDGKVVTCGQGGRVRPAKVVARGRSRGSQAATKPSVEPSLSEEHSLSETGVSDAPSRASRVSAMRDADWQERAEEILAETAFPGHYRRLGELLAEGNKTGRAALSRVVRELYEPLLELERDVGAEGMRVGLRAAIARPAPNANYVKKAAISHAERPVAVAATSRTIDRSDYDDFCTGGEL